MCPISQCAGKPEAQITLLASTKQLHREGHVRRTGLDSSPLAQDNKSFQRQTRLSVFITRVIQQTSMRQNIRSFHFCKSHDQRGQKRSRYWAATRTRNGCRDRLLPHKHSNFGKKVLRKT